MTKIQLYVAQLSVLESRSVVAWQWWMGYKGTEATFEGDRSILYLDCVGNTPVNAFVITHLMVHLE